MNIRDMVKTLIEVQLETLFPIVTATALLGGCSSPQRGQQQVKTAPLPPAEHPGAATESSSTYIPPSAGSDSLLENQPVEYKSPSGVWRAATDSPTPPPVNSDKPSTAALLDGLTPVSPAGSPYIVLRNGSILLGSKIHFHINSDKIKSQCIPALEDFARFLKQNPNMRHIEIQAHSDNRGNRMESEQLTRKRAEAVLNLLIRNGVDPIRLSAIGYGGTRPIEPNSTASGRAANKRIEFRIIK